ncbi:MAG: hypothetical protein ACRDMJ_01520 [Solirubrobacteraceae bacterium]
MSRRSEHRRPDRHAEAVLEARLGRPARDILEATVVLEAWTGRTASRAMSSARELVRSDTPPIRALSSVEPPGDGDQTSVVAEGITLVLLIVSIAAWATPIRRHLGPDVLSHAIRVALPIAVGLQWGLRSRYLGRPQGIACLARDRPIIWVAILTLVEVPLLLLGAWGVIAAMLVPIWVGSAILIRRGWGLTYAGLLVVATVVTTEDVSDPELMLGVLTAITLLMCVVAIRTRVGSRTGLRAGSISRALVAALIGGVLGVLLVADPSLGWGVHGSYPALALVPSVIGSYWGGYYLWNFYEAVPRGLRGVSLRGAGGLALSDPAMAIFIGAVARLVVATAVLSAVAFVIGEAFGGTDSVSLFVAFGCVGVVSMLVGMLEAFSLQTAALLAVMAALAAELAWAGLVGHHAAGGALAVGATLGVLLALPILLARVARSGRVLATTLWIQ